MTPTITIEKSRRRKPYSRPGDTLRVYEVTGHAFVPVECRMYVRAWNQTDAENEAHAVWHEKPRRRGDWVAPGTVDEFHPEQWLGHAEPVEGGAK